MHARRIGLVPVIGFALFGILSMAVAGFFSWLVILESIEQIPLLFSAIALFLLGLGFFFGCKFFKKEMDLDIIHNYLHNPTEFEFVMGEMRSAEYVYSSNRSQGRIIVEIVGKDPNGKEFVGQEMFRTNAWPFTTQEVENDLQKGDDWYELKGRRKILPVPVYLLYHKQFTYLPALVGIDENLIVTNL